MRSIFAFLFLAIWAVTSVGGAEIREFSLKTTESLGRHLYEQQQHPFEPLPPRYRVAQETAMAALPRIDRTSYHFAVLDDPEGNGFLVYALAYRKDPNDIVVGVHYRVSVAADGRRVRSADALSRSTLVLKKDAGIPKGATPAGLWLTSLVSRAPLETHVYLSLLHHAPLSVATADHSIWRVENGRISRARTKP